MLDDFIQYRVYSFYLNPIQDVIIRIGLLSARPLAGFLDIFFFAKFWGHLRIALIIILALYVLSGIFLYYLANRHFKCGFAFLVVFGLTPFVNEAVYWISASSRIVVSVFFAALCGVLLQYAIDRKKSIYVVFYFLFNLLSYALYEQGIVFSFALCMMILFLNRKKSMRANKSFLWAVPFINGAVIGCFYLFVRTGQSFAVSRAKIVDFNVGYLDYFSSIWQEIYKAVVQTGGKIISEGFSSGIYLLVEQKQYIYSAVIILAFGLCVFLLRGNTYKKTKWNQPLWGILLFALPFFPFFIVQNSAVTLRATFCSLFGLALVFDYLVRLVIRNKQAANVLLLIFAFVLLMGRVSETENYYQTGKGDDVQLKQLVSVLPTDWGTDKKAALIGPPEYYDESGICYYEHIYSVLSSQWALTGALRAVSEDKIRYAVYPIWAEKPVFNGYDDFEGYDAFYGYTGDVPVVLHMEKEGENYLFYDANNNEFAKIIQKYGKNYCMMWK